MQDLLNALNLDTLGLSLATAIATGIILALKGLLGLARRLTAKTATAADDKIVDETEAALKDQSKDL